MDKLVALVPTQNGKEVIAVPIKSLSSANLSAIASFGQLASSNVVVTTAGGGGGAFTGASSGTGGEATTITNVQSIDNNNACVLSKPTKITLKTAFSSGLDQSGTIRIPIRKADFEITKQPEDGKCNNTPASAAISLIGNSKIRFIQKDSSNFIQIMKTAGQSNIELIGDTTLINSNSPTSARISTSPHSPSAVCSVSESTCIEKPTDAMVKPPEKLIEMRLNSNQKSMSSLVSSQKLDHGKSLKNGDSIVPAPPALVLKTEVTENSEPMICGSPSSDFDPIDAMEWKNGIGTLPGSSLRFKLNEFGSLEMVDDTEAEEILQCLTTKLNEDKLHSESLLRVNNGVMKKTDSNEMSTCIHCGQQGLAANFVRKGRYCSQSCAITQSSKLKIIKKSNSAFKKRCLPKVRKVSVDKMMYGANDNTNDVIRDIDVADWCTQVFDRPGKEHFFSWKEYLIETRSEAAPLECFRPLQINSERKNWFRPNMKLEGIDPQHPSLFCVLTVVETLGFRVRLRFDGYDSSHDFWVNADSPFIFPCGWCSKTGRKLQSPKNMESFDWSTYLIQTKTKAAPKQCFFWFHKQINNPLGFKVGMKLEAVDKANSSLVCVASIADIIGNWLLIHFDGWDNSYDYWTDANSPHIHPINWCRYRGKPLTPPKDYHKSSDKFNWQEYLEEKKASFVNQRAFRTRAANNFRNGMKLEAVDKRNPRCVRVATIVNRQSHSIKIHFDSWDSKYDYWVDDDSADLHPIQWCYQTGHYLEEPPPFDYDPVSYYNRCPIFGCKGYGNCQNTRLSEHDAVEACPYSEENFDDFELADRLNPANERDSSSENLFNDNDSLNAPSLPPESIFFLDQPLPKLSVKSSTNKHPFGNLNGDLVESGFNSESEKTSRSVTPDSYLNTCPLQQSILDLRTKLHRLEDAPVGWDKHSRNLYGFVQQFQPQQVLSWNCEQVQEFVATLPGCADFATKFEQEKVDGEAFILLTQNDLVKILGVKLGPAVKIYNSILVIRKSLMMDSS